MKSYLRPISLITIIFLFSLLATAQPTAQIYQFTNGNWYDGKGFKKRTFYSVNGILTAKKPAKIDEIIDLKNQFVIPPFADAHTHNLDSSYNVENTINAYLAEGTFYVQVLANSTRGANAVKKSLNKPKSLDVIFANAALTCTYGHPFMVYEPLSMGIYNPAEAFKRIFEVKKSRISENDSYVFLDSKADVDAKWDNFLATKPEVLKIMLLDAENYDKLYANANAGDKGLSPEVAEYVVKKAHQAGLRVYAHIETANDFRLGLKIGLDGFAHAPNYGWNGKPEDLPNDEITDADIKLAAKKKVVIIPTAKRGEFSAVESFKDGKPVFNETRLYNIRENHRKLFNKFEKNGVKIALGYDNYGQTVMPEILYFSENKIFDNRTLLKIAVEDTPQSIFPNRKIGKLQEGFEASFITLEQNPLENFEAVKKINLRFKQGFFIEKPPLQNMSLNRRMPFEIQCGCNFNNFSAFNFKQNIGEFYADSAKDIIFPDANYFK